MNAMARGRKLNWADVACIGGIVAGPVWYLAMIPALPSLVGTHPVLLETLSGSLPAMVAAGAFARVGRTSLTLALGAPFIGLMAFDPFWWWGGRRYGDRILQTVASRNPRSARGAVRGLRLFRRYGGWTLVFAYYLPVPNNLLYAAAGCAGYSFLRFVVLDLIGTLLRITLDVGLGYALGGEAVATAGLITRYSVAVTVGLAVALLAVGWLRHERDHSAAPPATVAAPPAPDGTAAAQVEKYLRPLVARGSAPGLVYAVVTPGGQATGQLARSGSQPLGPHVLTEIGSVTKVFTALLLAGMAERGEVGLDDPIARHLPPEAARACPAAMQITLRHLATHTAGLPRIPGNLFATALRHPADPYSAYTTGHLYRALRRARRSAPAAYNYSNYGFGLLGHLLTLAAARPYGELITDRVTRPLGLTETTIGVPDGHPGATGHLRGRPAPRWHMDALAGAGALSSTASDLARFLQANLHPEETPIRSVIETIQRPQPSRPGAQQTGLGWHITERAGRRVLWHNGGTGGFSSMLALDRQAGCAVAAVATAAPTRRSPLNDAVFDALTELAADQP